MTIRHRLALSWGSLYRARPVSAVNGCGRCLESHEKVLRESGFSRELVQEGLRVAAVINAVAATLDAEDALAPAGV
jgi:alkyl hydroperoxide reductase subunit D